MSFTVNDDVVMEYLRSKGYFDTISSFLRELDKSQESQQTAEMDIETKIVSYNPCANDPFGATSMPIYQTATFQQLGATVFGPYDYTRSGNPTRDALQNIVAELEGISTDAKAFAFTTGMAAISAVVRLARCGDEVLVNDDSYGGTYRIMSQVAVNHGIVVKYINLSGREGPSVLRSHISNKTKLVMIESPTNPLQRICSIEELAKICHDNSHPTRTFLSIDNTMMSPILSRPLQIGADIVIHSATKFMAGHADTMAGVVVVRDQMIPLAGTPYTHGTAILGASGSEEILRSLSDTIYFFQNAEGSALAPFDCWLVLRGLKTMHLRVMQQQHNAHIIANWLLTQTLFVKSVIYCGFPSHSDYDIHKKQSTGGGCVVCFTTGNFELSAHIVTYTKLFKVTVSFGSVSSVISVPGQMSHASIPPEIRATREFPEDLIRMSIGIESPKDLIADLLQAMESFKSKN